MLVEFVCCCCQLMYLVGEDVVVLVVVVFECMCNVDVVWLYWQDLDFYYLCGFLEFDVVLVLLLGCKYGEVVLFCCEYDDEQVCWYGVFVGIEQVVVMFGMDDVFLIDDIDDILFGMIEGCVWVYCYFGSELQFDVQLLGWMCCLCQFCGGGVVLKEFVVLGYLLYDLCLFKLLVEFKLMCVVVDVVVDVYFVVMQVVQFGWYEYEVEVELLWVM